jgi:hypothetical protein
LSRTRANRHFHLLIRETTQYNPLSYTYVRFAVHSISLLPAPVCYEYVSPVAFGIIDHVKRPIDILEA